MKTFGLAFLTLLVACATRSPSGSEVDASETTADATHGDIDTFALAPDAPAVGQPDARKGFMRDGGLPPRPDAQLVPDGAVGTTCGGSECDAPMVCCVAINGTTPSYTCQGAADPCSGGTTSCDGPEDCTGTSPGAVCCGAFAGGKVSTMCSASCGAGNVVVCHNSNDCPSGQQCYPDTFTGSGYSVCF